MILSSSPLSCLIFLNIVDHDGVRALFVFPIPGEIRKGMYIDFLCDRTQQSVWCEKMMGSYQPTLFLQSLPVYTWFDTTGYYVFEWKTVHACPVGGEGWFLSSFCFFLSILLFSFCFISFLFFFSFISLTKQWTGCNDYANCGTCTQNPFCSWCFDNRSCVSSISSGCNNFVSQPDYCFHQSKSIFLQTIFWCAVTIRL